MTEPNTFSISKLIKEREILKSANLCLYEDSFLVATNIDSRDIHHQKGGFEEPIKMKDGCVILCRDGEFQVTCNLQDYTIRKNMLFICKPGSMVKFHESPHYNFSTFIDNAAYIKSLNLSIQKMVPHVPELRNVCLISLSEEDAKFVNRLMEMITTIVNKDNSALYYHESVNSIVNTYIYSVFSMFVKQVDTNEEEYVIETREEKHLKEFLSLLQENYKTERAVKFYADQMHITAKYLSSIVKNTTHRSPSDFIDEIVITEIKNLLKFSDMSIQEITYYLNFPNQSFFGKYFKRITGMSPRKYKLS